MAPATPRTPFVIGSVTVGLVLAITLFVGLGTGAQEPDCTAQNCAFRSGLFGSNEEWSYTFTEALSYPYHCHPHPWMQGEVTVQPAPEGYTPTTHTVAVREGNSNDVDTWDFFPAEITVTEGDTVVWRNTGKVDHEVMAFAGDEQLEAHTTDPNHDHGAHDHGDGGDKGASAPGWVLLVVVAVGAAAFVARRR